TTLRDTTTTKVNNQREKVAIYSRGWQEKRLSSPALKLPIASPYSAHGQIPRLAQRQGPGAPDARQGGARAARADRAGAGKAAQSRDRQGNRRRRLADRADRAIARAEASSRTAPGRRANEGEGTADRTAAA